ncbi:uncharacterized protein LOC101856344 [Aplysia californica]|uniref:Uncharacterized protein LOC101856344 n=1 Tax=Aplysia californica TaxID=6500 RepID=A0ABM0JQ41_APLCA|nr:uncharacterized protein LOC101856344 [Aplysia californica]XP_005098919.1 uncharacterized protein LOC101856344 [Aplysia californica]
MSFNNTEQIGSTWSLDSGLPISRENSPCLQHSRHPQQPLIIEAGILPVGNHISDAVVATFEGEENRQSQHKWLIENGQRIGSVTVQALHLQTPDNGQRPLCNGHGLPISPPDPKFKIVVKNLAGKSFKPWVKSTDTVLHLKELANQQWGIDRDQQIHVQLVYGGHKLEDDKTLGYYDMRDTDGEVQLITRLRGG